MDPSEAGATPSAATSLQPNEAIEPPREDDAVLELTWIQDDRLITSDVVRAALASLLGLILFSAIRWAVW
jgi:hypothetical protein